jgi:hypothetical protein
MNVEVGDIVTLILDTYGECVGINPEDSCKALEVVEVRPNEHGGVDKYDIILDARNKWYVGLKDIRTINGKLNPAGRHDEHVPIDSCGAMTNVDRGADYHSIDVLSHLFPDSPSPLAELATDIQVGGDHYKGFKYEPYFVAMGNNYNAFQASVFWYAHRYLLKGQAEEDINKIKHFCDMELQRLKEENNDNDS